MTELSEERRMIQDTARAFTQHRIGKREFLRRMALAGVGFSGLATTFLGQGRPFGGLTHVGTDLAAAETSDDVKKWLAEHRDEIEVFYLPSYSPELNPNEMANADLKHAVTKLDRKSVV